MIYLNVKQFEIIKYSYLSNNVIDHLTYQKDPSNYYILDLQANKRDHLIQTVYEISIPTCSYRMGVADMGYGMLTISKINIHFVYLNIT